MGLAEAGDRQCYLLRAAGRRCMAAAALKAFRPGAPSIVGSPACAMSAPRKVSIITWLCSTASGSGAKRVHPPLCWTAKASKLSKAQREGVATRAKIKGRKQHAMVDTDGRALKQHARAADI